MSGNNEVERLARGAGAAPPQQQAQQAPGATAPPPPAPDAAAAAALALARAAVPCMVPEHTSNEALKAAVEVGVPGQFPALILWTKELREASWSVLVPAEKKKLVNGFNTVMRVR